MPALPRRKKGNREEFDALEVWATFCHLKGTVRTAAGPKQAEKVSRGRGGSGSSSLNSITNINSDPSVLVSGVLATAISTGSVYKRIHSQWANAGPGFKQLESIPAATGRGRNTPQTAHTCMHARTDTHTQTHTPRGNLESPINLQYMFWDWGRKLEKMEKNKEGFEKDSERPRQYCVVPTITTICRSKINSIKFNKR